YLRWLRELLGVPTLERDDLGSHPYARVHLLAYGNAQGQPWSHLIFAGLNDEAWPALNDELAFIRDEQIDELNRQNKTLNRRASKRGRQGEGHWSVRDGKTLLLGRNEQRQIRRRQLFNLVESVSAGIAGSCGLRANMNSRSEVHSIRKNRYALPSGNKHCGGQLSSGWKSFSASSLTMTPATPGRLQPGNGSIDGSRTA